MPGRIRARVALAAPAGALWLAACGASPPSAPDPGGAAIPAGTVLSFVSGETDAPVAGASVSVAGRRYASDGAGRVTLAAPAAAGADLDVSAAAFLERKTSLGSGETRFTLWPRRSPTLLNEDFTAQIVYTASTGDALFAQEPLSRIRADASQVAVVPSAALRADPEAMERHARAVDDLNAATGGRPRYLLADATSAAPVAFPTRVDPGECSFGTLGFARLERRNREIVGGEIVFCSADAAHSAVVVHELGHSFGLNHTSNAMDVMAATASQRQAETFSPREVLVMNLMLQRKSGNRFPDDGRAAAAAAAGLETVRIDCR
jgi:hypothetical protein